MTVWYTAPTALRMLMRAGAEQPRPRPVGAALRRQRRRAAQPRGRRLGPAGLGLPVHDNWWQTETGGIMIANFVGEEIRPGSMGRPLPGVEAALLARDRTAGRSSATAGSVLVDQPDVEGELALRPGWPSMFRGYLHEDERYRRCFAGGWYLTGDLARRDADGWYWFVGRADDVIKSAGHLIGPFEVESVLMEHPAVAEAGVIGDPDPVAGRAGEGVRAAPAGSSRPRTCGWTSSASPAGGSARRWRRARSRSPTACRRPGAARSCAACCGPRARPARGRPLDAGGRDP